MFEILTIIGYFYMVYIFGLVVWYRKCRQRTDRATFDRGRLFSVYSLKTEILGWSWRYSIILRKKSISTSNRIPMALHHGNQTIFGIMCITKGSSVWVIFSIGILTILQYINIISVQALVMSHFMVSIELGIPQDLSH